MEASRSNSSEEAGDEATPMATEHSMMRVMGLGTYTIVEEDFRKLLDDHWRPDGRLQQLPQLMHKLERYRAEGKEPGEGTGDKALTRFSISREDLKRILEKHLTEAGKLDASTIPQLLSSLDAYKQQSETLPSQPTAPEQVSPTASASAATSPAHLNPPTAPGRSPIHLQLQFSLHTKPMPTSASAPDFTPGSSIGSVQGGGAGTGGVVTFLPSVVAKDEQDRFLGAGRTTKGRVQSSVNSSLWIGGDLAKKRHSTPSIPTSADMLKVSDPGSQGSRRGGQPERPSVKINHVLDVVKQTLGRVHGPASESLDLLNDLRQMDEFANNPTIQSRLSLCMKAIQQLSSQHWYIDDLSYMGELQGNPELSQERELFSWLSQITHDALPPRSPAVRDGPPKDKKQGDRPEADDSESQPSPAPLPKELEPLLFPRDTSVRQEAERIRGLLSAQAASYFGESGGSMSFDIFKFSDMCGGHPLLNICWILMNKLDLIQQLRLPADDLLAFFHYIERGYDRNKLFHNNIHAADVVHTSFWMLTEAQFAQQVEMSPFEVFAILFSAAIHDFRHPGFNNQFAVNSNHPLAIRYNDQSVLENYHVASAFELLLSLPHGGLFQQWDNEQRRDLRRLAMRMVLDTDMSKHTLIQNHLKSRLDAQDFMPQAGGNASDRELFFSVILHAADISNPGKPWQLATQWASMCMNEFWDQGDKEQALGLGVSLPIFDRYNTNMAKAQIFFINVVWLPFFEQIARYSTKCEEFVSNSRDNTRCWQNLVSSCDEELAKLKAEREGQGGPETTTTTT